MNPNDRTTAPRGDTQDSTRADNGGEYAEPWELDANGDVRDRLGRKPVLNGVALATGAPRADAKELTQRVLACVSACAGIPTERLNAVGRLMNAAKLRLGFGHNGSCEYEKAPAYQCTCGHDELGEALEELTP